MKNLINQLLKPIIIIVLIIIALVTASKAIRAQPAPGRIVDVTPCAKYSYNVDLFLQCSAEKVCSSDAIKNPIGERYYYRIKVSDRNKEIKDWNTVVTRSNIYDIEMKNACELDDEPEKPVKKKGVLI